MMENYIISIKRLNGLEPESIDDKAFPINSFGQSSISGASSRIAKKIGFSVKIDEIIYTEFFNYFYGWMFLKDPTVQYVSGFPWQDIINTVVYDNTEIKSTFTHNHLMLSPWFDSTGQIVSKNISSARSYYLTKLTDQVVDQVKQGIDTRNWPFDEFDCLTRHKTIYDPEKGMCLLVRWTNSENNYGKKYKFETAIFENGTIEFRYWPSKTYEESDSPPGGSVATIGVFSGASIGSNKFRDLSSLFDYKKNQRNISELGGTKYDAGFTDSPNTTPYASLLGVSNWPDGGAIVTLTPPTNSVVFLPRKIAKDISNVKKIVPASGIFDDRKTIIHSSGISVHYPTNLPSRLLGDSGDIDVSFRQILYTSGSIQTVGSSSKSAIEGMVSQIDTLEKSKKRPDNSFNESQKDYSSNTNESQFYATGSSLENFGEGFNSPLKSKTQFIFSFPVNKQTEMPSLTSSFYYYDQERKRWTTPYSSQIGQSPREVFIEQRQESERYFYYRVTETSLGFDAVGRKISSGSNVTPAETSFYIAPNGSFQTDPSIGAIFNQNSGSFSFEQSLIDSSLTKDYQNSITDSEIFYPKNYHQINVGIENPFLIEKIVAEIPVAVSGAWFNDVTTCNRAYLSPPSTYGYPSGAIDFGGPGLTFAIHCPRRGLGGTYLDLIASGTITHQFDDKKEVLINKVPPTKYYSIRPTGFRSFSNPTSVISGTYDGSQYSFIGSVILKMEASVAGGLTFARNDRSLIPDSSNITKAVDLVTKEKIPTRSELDYNPTDNISANYQSRAPRVYIQQVSPLSRGTSGFQFSGNSILGNSIASVQTEKDVTNPLYISSSGSLPTDVKSKIDSAGFVFDAVSSYSTVDSRPSPYLLLPGDKLSFSISKTRPVIKDMRIVKTFAPSVFGYGDYSLSGSHGNFILNTGSIDITIYGSYVRGGREYNP